MGGANLGKSPAMPSHTLLRDRPEVLDGLVKIIRGFGKASMKRDGLRAPAPPRLNSLGLDVVPRSLPRRPCPSEEHLDPLQRPPPDPRRRTSSAAGPQGVVRIAVVP